MAPSTGEQGSVAPLSALDGDVRHANGDLPRDNNAESDLSAEEDEEDGASAPLPSVEAMEDLILEAYNNMQSDGEHIFLPPDVASKLQLIAEMVKGAGYTSDDLVSNSSESNQEESARGLLSSDQHHTAPPSAASSAPSSPPTPQLALADDGAFPLVSHLRLDDHHSPSLPPTVEHDRKPTEPLVLESNNFEPDDTNASGNQIVGNNGVMDFAPALSPVQEIAEDLLSVSDLDSVVEQPLDTLTPPKSSLETFTNPKSSSSSSRERSQQAAEKPKSMLRKPEIHRKSSIPGRPSSVTKSQELNKPSSSGTRSNLAAPRVRTDSNAPPLSAERERSTSSSYEQRREAAQKLKEEKANRELQARESARKQREDARRKLEEAQQKEMAAKRERVARMRMQKDQRKGPSKPVSSTR